MSSRDRRTYTFDLKRTFRFHTGAAVTARSFADAFNRDADPGSLRRDELHARDRRRRCGDEGRGPAISGVRVLAPYRLQIRLTKPLGDFTARLTMTFFCPVLPNTPIDPRGIDNPAGSGPYYVAERVVNQRIVLRRNPYYRGDRPANVDQIVWTVGHDPEAAWPRRTRSDRHCAQVGRPPGRAHRALAQKYGINRPDGQLLRRAGALVVYLAYNHDRPAFNGPGQIPLKKAINYALDRPALAGVFGYLGGKRTDRMFPPALERTDRFYSLTRPDPATARKWLVRAQRKPRELVIYTINTSFGVAIRRGAQVQPEADRHRRRR